jgi:5-methylcytosine-specific restriction enzyme subunit McrC
MALLFEYDGWIDIENGVILEKMVQDIWDKRNSKDDLEDIDSEESEYKSRQQFLKFDGKKIKANNYIGFIQHGDELIEIYPKVFKHLSKPGDYKKIMLAHVFYWFNYCRKWRLPFSQASLDGIDVESFPELIINLIANQFFEAVSQQPLTMYYPIEESLSIPRGSINFKRYISNSLSFGNFHKIECDYEPFLFDNKVNQAIKYCSRLLLSQTKFDENIRMLQEVIFILDDVKDMPCYDYEINNISINPFFENYGQILDSCILILSQQLYSNNVYNLSQWCLLFPMEYIFEDFLAGYMEENFSNGWKVECQKSNEYLSNNPRVFQMRHDIFLTNKQSGRKIIIDTKYKLRDKDFKNSIKKGIEQSDMYQMISYAFRRGCKDIILVYPNIEDSSLNDADIFEIKSGFDGCDKINIAAIEIPFWSLHDFKNIKNKLNEKIEEVLQLWFKMEMQAYDLDGRITGSREAD